MRKDGYEFIAKIDQRGRVQIPKKVLELIEKDNERDKLFSVSIKLEE